MTPSRSSALFGAMLLWGCGATSMIEVPYLPLPAPEQGSGAVDVIHDLEAPGELPPLHTVALAAGDVEFRFGVVGHMALGGTQTIVRVTRVGGRARGEVWCHRLAWELADSTHPMPHQIARTELEDTPDWQAIVDSVEAIDLMTYRPGERAPAPEQAPMNQNGLTSERPLVPRDPTDQPSLLFEGRMGRRYRSFGMESRSPEDAVVWARVSRVIRMVWGGQHYGCYELAGPSQPYDPYSTTHWIVRPDSTPRH